VRVDDLGLSAGSGRRLRSLVRRWLTSDDELVISSDVHRTQERNRGECLKRLRLAIIQACRPPRIRRKTRPTRGSIERRLRTKKRRGDTKRDRRPPPTERP